MSTPSKPWAESLVPRLLYLVHPTAAGNWCAARSSMSWITAAALRHHRAGDDEFVANSLGTIPTTTIAPSLLLEDIGVKRATTEQQKLPYYSPPPLGTQ